MLGDTYPGIQQPYDTIFHNPHDRYRPAWTEVCLKRSRHIAGRGFRDRGQGLGCQLHLVHRVFHVTKTWSGPDHPRTQTGYLDAHETVTEVRRQSPGVLIKRKTGEETWVNEWDLEPVNGNLA